jgi:DNA-binding CsgD family transcriptional regulator
VDRAERFGRPWAPYAFEARHQLAWVCYVTGRFDEALALLAIAVPGAPALPFAALDAIRLSIRQARGEKVPLRIHRSQWEIDGIVVAFSAATEIRAATTPAAVLQAYGDARDALTRAWGPGFAAGVRLSATVLGRLAELGGADVTPETADALAADALIAQRDHAEGPDWGPEGRAWIDRVEAERLRLRWLLAGGAPSDELVSAWRRAEASFAAFGHVHELALARTAYAEVLRAAGDAEAARGLAEQARAAARALGARPLLARLGDSGPATPDATVALTARETEILALVAEGRSNGEIGRQLFISTKTVSVHVSNILAKLGAASRTQAAAIAHRRGLLG